MRPFLVSRVTAELLTEGMDCEHPDHPPSPAAVRRRPPRTRHRAGTLARVAFGRMSDLRSLPSVDRLAAELDAAHPVAVAAARAVIDERRAELRAGASGDVDLLARARERVARIERRSPRRVLNATGVIVHTNLGRAPLAEAAQAAVARVARGYCDLEWDVERGERGSRHDHVAGLLCELTGAEAAMAVNNCAAAVLLAAAALAGPERELVVSRGRAGRDARAAAPAGSSWRSAAASACRTSSCRRAPGSSRSALPTARAAP